MSSNTPVVWVVRHGQTEWSQDGRHTSTTDIDLTPEGESEATALRPWATAAAVDMVLCSPRCRARRTAELAGLEPYEVTEDLAEWAYGDMEGRTTSEIHADYPGWSIWEGPWPGGETAAEVTARADRLIRTVLDSGAASVALVGHGHFSRVVAARWVGEPVAVGRWLYLDTATFSRLGWDRDDRVLREWNVPASAISPRS